MFYHWKIIALVEIIFYVLSIISTVYPFHQSFFNSNFYKSKFKSFYLRFFFLSFAKLISGVLLLPYIHQVNVALTKSDSTSSVNLNLLISAISLNSVSLGLLTLMNLFVVKYVEKLNLNSSSEGNKSFIVRFCYLVFPINFINLLKDGFYLMGVESFIQKTTLYAIIINVVGSAISNGTSPSTQVPAKTLLRAGSLMYLISNVFNAGFIVIKLKSIKAVFLRKLLWLTLCVTPLLTVRIIYNLCYAFTFMINYDDGFNINHFTFLFGDWTVYVGVAFLEECLCVVLFVTICWIVFREEERFVLKE